MSFNLDDFRSPTWRKIKAYAEAEIKQHQINLESDAGPERTQKLRGSIQTLKLLLAIEDHPPIDEEENLG